MNSKLPTNFLDSQGNFSLFTRDQPPSNFEFLLFERSPSAFARRLLTEPDFESEMPEQYRLIAALSLESFVLNAYLLSCQKTKQVTVCRHSVFLNSKRPANPCLCLTFNAVRNSQGEEGLISLLLYNEFQMPLGVYDHQANIFFVYAQMPHEQSIAFFYKECGSELLHELQRLTQQHDFQSINNASSGSRALAIGYNKSFGHAHWNDVLGYLHLRSIRRNLPVEIETLCVLVGSKTWIDPSDIIDAFPIFKSTANQASDYLLSQNLIVHQPLGFKITKTYERFWAQEVTANAARQTVHSLANFKSHHYPIVSINLRFSEYWRRSWHDPLPQLLQIAKLLAQHFPRIAYVFDGMTAFASDSAADRKSNYPDSFWSMMSSIGVGYIDISGLKVGDKALAYKLVHYEIGQFGSGSTIPAWVYAIPSTCISAESEIISSYSAASVITRICKPALHDLAKYGNFLPLDCIDIGERTFTLRPKQAAAHILAHMLYCRI